MQKIDAEVVNNAVAVVEHVFPGEHQRNGRRYVGEDHQRTRGFAQAELAVEKHRHRQPEHGAARHHQRGIPDRHPQRMPEAGIGEDTHIVTHPNKG